jgi:hypothetical protein
MHELLRLMNYEFESEATGAREVGKKRQLKKEMR